MGLELGFGWVGIDQRGRSWVISHGKVNARPRNIVVQIALTRWSSSITGASCFKHFQTSTAVHLWRHIFKAMGGNRELLCCSDRIPDPDNPYIIHYNSMVFNLYFTNTNDWFWDPTWPHLRLKCEDRNLHFYLPKRQERVAVCEMVRKAAADEGKAPVKFSDNVNSLFIL